MPSIQPEYAHKISRWIELDKIVESKKNKLRRYTEEKNKLEQEIIKYTGTNGLVNKQISLNHDVIKVVENTTNQVLTLKTLKELLNSFFRDIKNHPDIVNAVSVYEFILKNRNKKQN